MSFRKPFAVSRRAVLRGAGVAITLPWLESLAPRAACAQNTPILPRFLPIYLPNGAPELWKPALVGAGNAWALSSVLELLKPLKSKVAVVSGFGNGSVFNPDGGIYVAPEHARPAGAWLTCEDSRAVREQLQVQDANGVSFDQLLARHAPAVGDAPLASLQVGLSSTKSYCDAEPCSLSRSVSWRTQTEPTGKLVDPKAVFEQLVGAAAPPETPEQTNQRAVQQSVLDAVGESALTVRSRLSSYDRLRLDEFMQSLRSVEQRATQLPSERPLCRPATMPVFPDLDDEHEYRQNTPEYSKARHADLMNDLIALAFQCNLTRIVSYMLEDERSEFTYDHVAKRKFTAEGSVPGEGFCGEYRGASHGDADEFASITWWNVGKVAQLCQSLAGVVEDDYGHTVLDNTVVFLGSCMHGQDHRVDRLPALLIGGGSALRLDQHLDLGKRPLRDLYYTLANSVYGMNLPSFGIDRTGAPHATISELLAL